MENPKLFQNRNLIEVLTKCLKNTHHVVQFLMNSMTYEKRTPS